MHESPQTFHVVCLYFLCSKRKHAKCFFDVPCQSMEDVLSVVELLKSMCFKSAIGKGKRNDLFALVNALDVLARVHGLSTGVHAAS